MSLHDDMRTAPSPRIETPAPNGGPGAARLGTQLATIREDLEQVRVIVTRSLETLAAVSPAIDELSAVVLKLQESLFGLKLPSAQPATEQPQPEATTPAEQPQLPPAFSTRPIEIEVERVGGQPLDLDAVSSALENLRDLAGLLVADRNDSWVKITASADESVNFAILEAKITGALARNFSNSEKGPIEVRLRQLEAAA